MNKSELEDIIAGADDASVAEKVGIFLISGALWAGVAHLSGADPRNMTLLVFYGMCVVLGLTLLWVCRRDRRRNRRHLDRILNESKVRRD